MDMKVGLTFACMNLKKLAKIKQKWGYEGTFKSIVLLILNSFQIQQRKTALGYAP